MSPIQESPADDDKPPVLGSWRNIYAFVLALHVVLILLFYVFSQAYT